MDLYALLGYIGLAVSFVYLWLEFKQRPSMWLWSIACSCIYIVIYFHKKIYADVGFSAFNICISVWGFAQWLKPKSIVKRGTTIAAEEASDAPKHKGDEQIEYRTLRLREWLQVIAVTALVYTAIYLFLDRLTDSPVPARDALNTTLNIVGTWILGRKVIEVWGFWFLANIFSVYLYWVRDVGGDMLPSIILYLFYTGASVYGYWKWKKRGIKIK